MSNHGVLSSNAVLKHSSSKPNEITKLSKKSVTEILMVFLN